MAGSTWPTGDRTPQTAVIASADGRKPRTDLISISAAITVIDGDVDLAQGAAFHSTQERQMSYAP